VRLSAAVFRSVASSSSSAACTLFPTPSAGMPESQNKSSNSTVRSV
jgi:hypothetical protein